jgi:hypothetical protein
VVTRDETVLMTSSPRMMWMLVRSIYNVTVRPAGFLPTHSCSRPVITTPDGGTCTWISMGRGAPWGAGGANSGTLVDSPGSRSDQQQALPFPENRIEAPSWLIVRQLLLESDFIAVLPGPIDCYEPGAKPASLTALMRFAP